MAQIEQCPLFGTRECCGQWHLDKLNQVKQVNVTLKTTYGRTFQVPKAALGETYQDMDSWVTLILESEQITDFLATEGYDALDKNSQKICGTMHPGGTIQTSLKSGCPNFNP